MGLDDERRSKSAPRPTAVCRRAKEVKEASRGRAQATTAAAKRNARCSQLKRAGGSTLLSDASGAHNAATSKVWIRALRLPGWNTVDRSMLQTLLCKRTAASYVAAFTDVLVAEVSDRRCICIYDWGCLCVIDEIESGFAGIVLHEDDAFRQFLEFLLQDVVFPSSSLPCDTIESFRLTDEDQDSMTLMFVGGGKGRKNPIENDVVYLEPTESAEERRKCALACALALGQSLSLKGVEIMLQQWIERSFNPRTLILAESGEVPDEPTTLKLYGQYTGFVQEVDVIGQALAMPADIDAEYKGLYLMTYEYLEVEARQKVMQDRFDIIKASLSLFKTLRESSESTRKERIIIWLLVVCVVIAALELLVKILSLRQVSPTRSP
jgi:hypothetical protein